MPLEVEPLDDPSTEKGWLPGLESPLVGEAAITGGGGNLCKKLIVDGVDEESMKTFWGLGLSAGEEGHVG